MLRPPYCNVILLFLIRGMYISSLTVFFFFFLCRGSVAHVDRSDSYLIYSEQTLLVLKGISYAYNSLLIVGDGLELNVFLGIVYSL